MKTKLIFIIGFVIIISAVVSFSSIDDVIIYPNKTITISKIETFAFSSHGKNFNGKIYLPSSYESNKALPSIYLIDFTEQHFKIATDEFEKIIDGVNQIPEFDALVVTLEEILDIDTEPETFQEQYEVFKNVALYVDSAYTKNPSRTFIGRGSEAGVVLMALFIENPESSVFDNFIVTDPSPKYATAVINLFKKDKIPINKSNQKLHFSFSTSNDRENV